MVTPIEITATEASDAASRLNARGGDFAQDYYGNSWTQQSYQAAHSNTDANQRKRLIYLLALLLLALALG